MNIEKYCFAGNNNYTIDGIPSNDTGHFSEKDEAVYYMKANVAKMVHLQGKFYADAHYGVLIIFQGIDASGKDGAIKHVMSGLNPQGVNAYSFKKPTPEELAHDYLWRCNQVLPERGKIGIFNRSYYEEVTTVKVHRENLLSQHLPEELMGEDLFSRRYEDIVNYERYLCQNGIIVLKFFLHLSKDEQRKRLLSRVKNPDKNWKFSVSDLKERNYWDDYRVAFEEMIQRTGSEHAPWYVIPADHKWYARYLISEVIINKFESLKLSYPPLSEELEEEISIYRRELEK